MIINGLYITYYKIVNIENFMRWKIIFLLHLSDKKDD